ncbi:MAG: hypothetical protein KDB05_24735 [Planctomycetales bacterium]|nr:hypothetical protein [Planctomycetales bacterium]
MTDRDASSPEITLTTLPRVLVSLFLIVHIVAILTPPFMLQASGPGGTSPVGEAVMNTLQPYIDITFLNHGYAFFAPNPGPSHLVRARMEFDDGREPIEETFPNLNEQWPRLLYHRHFMLSEQLTAQYQPPQLPQELSQEPELAERWQMARRMYELKLRKFKEHLQSKYDAPHVTLTRVQHRMIDVIEVAEQHKRLDASDTFFDLREDGFIPQEGFMGGVP